MGDDGGVAVQHNRESAELQARHAAQTGDKHDELLAEGTRYLSEKDWRRAARAFREAIALRPDDPLAYFNLGVVLHASGQNVEAAKRYLEAVPRFPVGSENWANAIANAFLSLSEGQCDQVVKPEW